MFSAGLLCSVLLAAAGGAIEADAVIQEVTIHDGSGAAAVTGDIAVRGERIVALGRFSVAGTPRRIDGRGLVAAPGFIDLHTHSDSAITRNTTRLNRNYLTQGVTTVVTGNCGGGRLDVARYLAEIDQAGAGTNVAHLIPHGTLRGKVMGGEKRPPTADELARMKESVEQLMREGAWGMSTGLIYVPSCFAETAELVELSRAVARHGGLYVSHIRNEGNRLLEAIEEALAIGRQAGVPVHISHLKASGGRRAWELAPAAIQLIQKARAAGQAVTADQYPYIASSTSLEAMLIPEEYRGAKRLAQALQDPASAEKLRRELAQRLADRNGGKSMVIASYAKDRSWQGKDLAWLAEKTGKSAVDLVLAIQKNGGASMISFGMREEDVRSFMQQAFVATASDGGAREPDNTLPHPRSYGCFPRKVGRYALENQVIPLEHAIRSASGLPADIFGFPERGYLRVGYFADILVFDPRTFRDTATFDKPHQYATGVRYLWVNGKLAIDDGRVTGTLAGRALRHRGRSSS